MVHAVNIGRLGAAIAILFLHTVLASKWGSYGNIGRFAVPFFTITSCYFTLNTALSSSSFKEFIYKRIKKIYLVFLIWNCIYFFIRFCTYEILLKQDASLLFENFFMILFINGFAHHLWFLPFIFICSIVLYLSTRYLRKEGELTWFWRISFSILILLSYHFDLLINLSSNYVLILSHNTLPALAASFLIKKNNRIAQYNSMLLFLFLYLFFSSLFIKYSYIVYNLSGIILFVYCLNSPLILSKKHSKIVSTVSFGIYLNHILFVEGIQKISFKFFNLKDTFSTYLLIFILSLLMSVSFCFIVDKLKLKILNGVVQ
ncbi:acyltransferase family protein [Lentisphaera marina]|uniref:acyltransferase family protein n=1 Tax=Lentisphaera marina TaxID=1111041 RepID=UPI003B685A64